MPAKRRVLIADAPEAQGAIAQCLAGRKLNFAETLEAAKLELVQRAFHLVVVGLRFDDSRMLELLTFMRTSSRYVDIPVVCVQVGPGGVPALDRMMNETLKLAGASGFIRIDGRGHEAVCQFLGGLADGVIPMPSPGAAQS